MTRGKRKNPAAVSLGRKGGAARAKSLTAEQRQAIARKGGEARAAKREADAPANPAKTHGHKESA